MKTRTRKEEGKRKKKMFERTQRKIAMPIISTKNQRKRLMTW
jgi:hypothetical protein